MASELPVLVAKDRLPLQQERGPESSAVLTCQMVSLIMHELISALDSRARAEARANAWSGLTWP